MSIKGFSALTVKSVDEERRELTGIATTPSLDRVKDSIDPMGLRFAKEVPLLLQHDHARPVGTVQFGKPTPKGLSFVATIAKVDTPGAVKDRTDEAWDSVKAGLIRAVSVGFRPDAYEPNEHGGLNFKSAEVHELSLVTIPCQPDAVIQAFKSLQHAEDTAQAGAEVPGENPETAQGENPAQTTEAAQPRVSLLPFLV